MSTLAYDTVGEGERAVLLLHGFLGSGRNLKTLARKWAERTPVRLVLPDLLGHGESPALPPEAGLDALAGPVLDLADDLGLPGPLTLVGHSLGGRVALAAARRAPDRVGSVTLLDIRPGPLGGDEESEVMRCLKAAPGEVERRETVRDFFVDEGIPRPIAEWLVMNLVRQGGAYRWRIDREALAALLRRQGDEDLWPVVEAGGFDLRLIRGERSPYVRPEDEDRLRALQVPVDVVKGAGHFLHVDRPDVVAQLLAATV